MPTHRDYPWEQDARRMREGLREPRRPPAAARRAPARTPWSVIALVAVVLVAGLLGLQQRVGAADPEPAAGTVSGLQSRWAPDGALEAWGRTDAVDGSTVTVRVDGGAEAWPAPVSGGRFYLRATPRSARRGLSLRAAVTG